MEHILLVQEHRLPFIREAPIHVQRHGRTHQEMGKSL